MYICVYRYKYNIHEYECICCTHTHDVNTACLSTDSSWLKGTEANGLRRLCRAQSDRRGLSTLTTSSRRVSRNDERASGPPLSSKTQKAYRRESRRKPE